MSRKQDVPFEVFYLGTDFGSDARPPRSAKLVAAISWGWAPGHDRLDRYLISSDRKRTGWALWCAVYDEWESLKWIYAKLAWGSPCRGYTVEWAAERLLTAAWLGEKESYGSDLKGAYVDQEGLLTKKEIEGIERRVFGESE